MPPFVWQPSGQRRIGLFGSAARSRADRPMAILPLRWPDHPAPAELDYELDAGALLSDATDTLSVTACTVTGIALRTHAVLGGLVVLWLGPATLSAGQDATIDLTLQTGAGRRVHRIIRIRIA